MNTRGLLKEAALSQESVQRAQIPMSSVRPVAVLPPSASDLRVLGAVVHDVHEVLEEAGVPGVQHGHAAQHLTHDDLDVLGGCPRLGAADLLDLLDEVALGGGHRAQAQDLLGSTDPR